MRYSMILRGGQDPYTTKRQRRAIRRAAQQGMYPRGPVENCPGGVICGWDAQGNPICASSVSQCGTLTSNPTQRLGVARPARACDWQWVKIGGSVYRCCIRQDGGSWCDPKPIKIP